MNEECKILILKRSANSKTNPKKWKLPGGKAGLGSTVDFSSDMLNFCK